MSKRLQVVMTEEEYGEIRDAAERNRATVSEWVRRVLREAREHDRRVGTSTVHESPAQYDDPDQAFPQRVSVEMNVKAQLLEAVRLRYHLPNWRAAVEYALKRVAIRPMTKVEALEMQGAGWDGDLGEMRAGDPGSPW